VGLSLFVFAVVALSGPGRIDIVDGQTRYEVARSLVEHGDHVIRNDKVWFWVFPGRDGQPYTKYRFPQSLVGVATILASDAFGPVSEGRRHFYFTLSGAFFCGILALVYAGWFRHQGLTTRAAISWAGAGIFCTPNWFYGTSTFDDILGSTALIVAVVVAFLSRERWTTTGAVAAGLVLGLAFNCKEPLGAFLPVVIAAHYDRRRGLRAQLGEIALVVLGLGLGIAAYKGYDWYKYPPGATPDHAALLARYIPFWPGNPLAAILGFALSPAAGVIWYCPTLVVSGWGFASWYGWEKWLCRAILLSCAVFVLFLASLTFFKGDPAWGPRYLTPVFALAWLFAPDGASRLVRVRAPLWLALGFLVQLAALSVDPHRLYLERGLPSSFCVSHPWLYFHPAVSHLLNRPREIVELLSPDRPESEAFTPSPSPTFAFPVLDFVEEGPSSIHAYRVLNSFRPWWISQQYLPYAERPVAIGTSVLVLLVLGGFGIALTLISLTVRPIADHSRLNEQGQVDAATFTPKQEYRLLGSYQEGKV
jgi:hypothetical protein